MYVEVRTCHDSILLDSDFEKGYKPVVSSKKRAVRIISSNALAVLTMSVSGALTVINNFFELHIKEEHMYYSLLLRMKKDSDEGDMRGFSHWRIVDLAAICDRE